VPGNDPERQLALAREADALLDEGRELERLVDEMEPDDPERQDAQARLDRILARRAEIDEKLLELQGVTKRAEVIQIDERRKRQR
jgi:hypothetical protein